MFSWRNKNIKTFWLKKKKKPHLELRINDNAKFFMNQKYELLFVSRFYGPVNLLGSC